MMKHSKARWLLGLATLGAALAFTGAAVAAADSVPAADYPDTNLGLSTNNGTISVHGGNFVAGPSPQDDCTDFGLTAITSGTTFTGNTSTGFTFTSTTPVGLVAVKGANAYILYDYRTGDYGSGVGGGAKGDSPLFTPINASGGHAGLSDVTFCSAPGGVAAAQLRSLTAKASARSLTVSWRTASEIDVAGYSVYGYFHGVRVKLNARLIASKSSGPNAYSFRYQVPRGKAMPSRVALQVVNLDGTRQWRTAKVAH
jgi:hypothetical protein